MTFSLIQMIRKWSYSISMQPSLTRSRRSTKCTYPVSLPACPVVLSNQPHLGIILLDNVCVLLQNDRRFKMALTVSISKCDNGATYLYAVTTSVDHLQRKQYFEIALKQEDSAPRYGLTGAVQEPVEIKFPLPIYQ